MKNYKILFYIVILFSIKAHSSLDEKEFFLRLNQVKKQSSELILSELRENKYFNMPSFLGTPYTVQYMLYTQYSNKEYLFPKVWQKVLKEKLEKERREDGSWRYLRSENIDEGELSATIVNYWGLKVMGVNPNSFNMLKTKNYIISKGGLDNANLFLKIFLALFDNYSYQNLNIPLIPLFIFSDSKLLPPFVKTKQFGQWIAPHLLPIAYFSKFKVKKYLNAKFILDELHVNKTSMPTHIMEKENFKRKTFRYGQRKSVRSIKVQKTNRKFIKKMLSKQEKFGSYGGYTLATFLTNIAYDHYLENNPNSTLKLEILKKSKRGDEFLTNRHYDKEKKIYIFDGWTCDGRIWDSALLTQALFESKEYGQGLFNVVDYVLGFQTKDGGFPFGLDFENYPDHDDSAEVLLMLELASRERPLKYKKEILKLKNWLLKRQNNDGGWGAFDVNNNGNFLLKFLAKDFLDSSDLFDESSADVTAHVLEALAATGLNIENSKQIRDAVHFLEKKKNEKGLWFGRWGVNYVYGTSAVITALSKVGVKNSDPLLKEAINWLENIQNFDGGYGESIKSYQGLKESGVGVSTASQTAWALNALVNAGLYKGEASTRASLFLIKMFEKRGEWIDSSVVGTGHPGIVYMDYPSYAYAFPLIALSNLSSKLENDINKKDENNEN